MVQSVLNLRNFNVRLTRLVWLEVTGATTLVKVIDGSNAFLDRTTSSPLRVSLHHESVFFQIDKHLHVSLSQWTTACKELVELKHADHLIIAR